MKRREERTGEENGERAGFLSHSLCGGERLDLVQMPGVCRRERGGGVDVFAFGFDSHRITLTSTRASFFDATTY